MSKAYVIDDLDRDIIQLLSEDARLSNRKIASKLGFTEGTIRSRVKRLEDDNFIRFTAVTNMSNLETPLLAYIGIHAEQSKIKKLAEAIAELDEINGVLILLGRFDILAIGLFEGLQQVHQIASNRILDLDGVRLVETSVVVDVLKYDNRVAKIMAPLSEKNLKN